VSSVIDGRTDALALIGMGRMGRLVDELAGASGWSVVSRIGGDSTSKSDGVTKRSLAGASIAIEFTTAAAAPANVLACARVGCPVVSGTTGWDAARADVEDEITKLGGALLWSPNFALGAALFARLVDDAARLLRGYAGVDTHIVETHHAAKRDAPSGTARELARRAGDAFGRPVPVTSVRVGSVPGTHEIVFDAPYEQIAMTHVARDRRVFADGALRAARWLLGRQGVYTLDDMLSELTRMANKS
jgi:4-hydroxy-tetrahydrodipicolinate reductase